MGHSQAWQNPGMAKDPLETLRRLCLALPETTEPRRAEERASRLEKPFFSRAAPTPSR